ncbi:Transmembrane protein 120 [Balamuthia mandrillaris]
MADTTTNTAAKEKESLDQVAELRKALEEAQQTDAALREQTLQVKKALQSSFRELDSLVGKLKAQKGELMELKRRLGRLKRPRSVSSSASSSVPSSSARVEDTDETSATAGGAATRLVVDKKEKKLLLEELRELEASRREMYDDLAPGTGGFFVRLFLGQVNVKLYREDERFLRKRTYERFKTKANLFLFLLVIVQLWLFPASQVLDMIFQLYLVYYYVSIALRENILKVNGSNINLWWIIHHYISITIALVLMTWSQDDRHQFQMQFRYFCLCQTLVQVLLNWYQMGRLYQLVAMGKAGTMDVAGGEGWVDWAPTRGILLPFLLFMQGFQLYNGWTLARSPSFLNIQQWQVTALAVLFACVGLGNFFTTVYTYIRPPSHNQSARRRRRSTRSPPQQQQAAASSSFALLKRE